MLVLVLLLLLNVAMLLSEWILGHLRGSKADIILLSDALANSETLLVRETCVGLSVLTRLVAFASSFRGVAAALEVSMLSLERLKGLGARVFVFIVVPVMVMVD